MTKTRLLTLLALVLITATLAACELSASTPPPTTLTSESPMTTLQSQLEAIATQTAAAGGGVVQPTSPPLEATNTPASPPETPVAPTEPEPTSAEQPTAAPTKVPPTSAPPPVVPTATPGFPATYTLQPGEYPYCIARRFNVDQNELIAINGLSIDSRPGAGTTLKIPQTGNPFISERALREHPTKYTVEAGETIYVIACKFGDVSPDAIAEANNLKAPFKLKAGKVIHIP